MLEVACSQQEAKQAVEEQAGQWPLAWYCSEPVGQNAAVLREQMHKAGASRALAVQRADNGGGRGGGLPARRFYSPGDWPPLLHGALG